jgi:hypothetical protein
MKKKFVAAYLAALVCASAQTYEQKIENAMERVDRVTMQRSITRNENVETSSFSSIEKLAVPVAAKPEYAAVVFCAG